MEDGSIAEHEAGMMENEMTHATELNKEDSLISAKSFIRLGKNAFYRDHLACDGDADALAAKDGLNELKRVIYQV